MGLMVVRGERGDIIEFIDLSARTKRLIMLSSLRMKTYFFFLIPLLALWAMAPQQLLEVDPSLVLNPDMIGILRKAILHEGCPYKEISDLVVTDMTQCTCGENPIHRPLAEEFQQKQELVTNNSLEEIRKNRIYPLVIAISTAILISMLHSQVHQ